MSVHASLPLVSVVIPVYNGRAVIEDCLDALFRMDYPEYEVIAVDDRSKDSSAEFIRGKYSRVSVLTSKRNRGFAAAVNLGIRAARGEIVALLNMDTVVEKCWLRAMVETLVSDDSIGLVGSKIFCADAKTLQHCGGKLKGNAMPVHIGRGETDRGQYDLRADVDYLCGASLAFRRRLTEEIGFLDEGYRPLYFEDTDFAHRVRSRGLRVVYVPDSVLIHRENFSTNGLSADFYYNFHKSRLRFVFKNHSLAEIGNGFLGREKQWFLKELPRQMRPALARAYVVSLPGIAAVLAARIMTRGKR